MLRKKLILSLLLATLVSHAGPTVSVESLVLARTSQDFEAFKREYALYLHQKHAAYTSAVLGIGPEELQKLELAMEMQDAGKTPDLRTIDPALKKIAADLLSDPEKRFVVLDTYTRSLAEGKPMSVTRIVSVSFLAMSGASAGAAFLTWNNAIHIREFSVRMAIYLVGAIGTPLLGGASMFAAGIANRNENVYLPQNLKLRKDALLEVLAASAYIK